MTHVTLSGVRIHSLTIDAAVCAGLELLEEDSTHWCFTPNPKLLTLAARDEGLRGILNGAHLSLADGVGVVLAARLTGQGDLPRCPGADYALALAQAAGARHNANAGIVARQLQRKETACRASIEKLSIIRASSSPYSFLRRCAARSPRAWWPSTTT